MIRKLDLICKNDHISNDQIVTEDKLLCPVCGEEADSYWANSNIMVVGDDIPGGIWIKHGICNPDGTPKKYYSKSEIREAAAEKGLTISGETPKLPSKVYDQKAKEAEKLGRRFI